MAIWSRPDYSPVPHPRGIVVHALHKSASMFLYQLMFRLARDGRYPFYSANHAHPNDHQLTRDATHRFCLGPIRHFHFQDLPFDDHIDLHRIVQVRDPRDILVSQYFSFGWNHSENDFNREEIETRQRIRNLSVDEYVTEPGGAQYWLLRRLKPLLRFAKRPQVHLVRYEEMVSNFGNWLGSFIEPFGFSPTRQRLLLLKYRAKYGRAFRPEQSRSGHKRNVVPGEHRTRLQPGTIAELDRAFGPYLDLLGYHRGSPGENAA